MGIPSQMRDYWLNRRGSFLIPSPAEDQRVINAKNCTQEGVRAGTKAAIITAVVTTVPTLAAVRVIPWAKANINYTGQDLIICSASVASYFSTVDKTILECARRNAQSQKPS